MIFSDESRYNRRNRKLLEEFPFLWAVKQDWHFSIESPQIFSTNLGSKGRVLLGELLAGKRSLENCKVWLFYRNTERQRLVNVPANPQEFLWEMVKKTMLTTERQLGEDVQLAYLIAVERVRDGWADYDEVELFKILPEDANTHGLHQITWEHHIKPKRLV